MKILVAGDYCPQSRVADLFEKGDYASVLGDVKAVIEEVDFSIVNLECPVTRGGEKPITKWGPNLQCSENGVKALKWVGFDGVTLANNHFLDYRKEGVLTTIEVCKKYGIDTVGGGRNLQEASTILYKEFEGRILAIINCCENEFSIATETSGGSNPLNPIQQYYAIKKAQEKADYVLVIVHGGHEYYQLPSPRMQEVYRFFVDAGADAVINHHQHCYSGYEIYQGKPIFYGLGNFCYDEGPNKSDMWFEGYMVILQLDKRITFDIIPYNQCSYQARVHLLKTTSFDDELKRLNTIITNLEKLRSTVNQYYESCTQYYSDIIEPSNNRYYLACKHRGWLPSFITQKRKFRAANYILCEAHRDKLIYYLHHL